MFHRIKNYFFLLLLVLKLPAFSVTPVYFSVGTSTSDFKTGTPTVTISNDTATFSTAQTGNIGVGDEITYNTSSIAYITGKVSTTKWTVMTATGGVPADVSGQTVDSIKRAFNSLNAAVDGSASGIMDADHLNLTAEADITASGSDLQINVACYADGEDTSGPVSIEGFGTWDNWGTDATHYIRIFTPTNTNTECNSSQRHSGDITSGYILSTSGTGDHGISVGSGEGHTRIEGLIVKGPGVTSTNNGISGDITSYLVKNCIVTGFDRGINGGRLKYDTYIENTLIYDCNTRGIRVGGSSNWGNIFAFNVTVVNCDTGAEAHSEGHDLVLRNCIFQDNSVDIETDDNQGQMYVYNTITQDGVDGATGADTDNQIATLTFSDKFNDDYRLASGDTEAIDNGADLSTGVSFPFTDDIRGLTRPLINAWDIGAFEFAPDLLLGEHTASQEPDAFEGNRGVADAELFAFKFTPKSGVTPTVTQLVFSITDITGLADGDWAGVELVVDSDGDGDISGGETTTVGGSGTVNTSGNTITFSTSFNVSAATDYILRADFSSLSSGDAVTIGLLSSNITLSTGTKEGSVSDAYHAEEGWYNTNWDYRQKLTVDYTKVSGTADLDSFPALITDACVQSSLFDNAKSDGSDIVLTLGDGVTKLKRELVYYGTGTADTMELWVNIPALKHNSATGIYLYYGNSGASETNDAETWDSNFKMVHHLQNSSVLDATANNNDGNVRNSPAFQAGKIGNGIYIDAEEYINVPHSTSLDFNSSNELTVEAWVYHTALDGGQDPAVIAKGDGNDFMLGYNDPSTERFRLTASTTVTLESGTVTTGEWRYYVGVYNGPGGYASHYRDTVQLGLNQALSGNINHPADSVSIGIRPTYGSYIHGTIDELRLSNTARSVSWMNTCYNNYNSPSTFWSASTEEEYSYDTEACGESPCEVYYSVGESTSDLKTGTPTISISSGTATFSTAQTGDIGVGDKITFNDSWSCYIKGKTSSTVWTVSDADGAKPTNISGLTVNSIKRTFNSLGGAIDGSTSGSENLLGTGDLVTGDYFLHIACYNDDAAGGSVEEGLSMSGWTTDSDNYIHIFTPDDTSTLCNSSQRFGNTLKSGGNYTGFAIVNTSDYGTVLDISGADYTHIEGLLFVSTANHGTAAEATNTGDFLTVSDCWFEGVHKGLQFPYQVYNCIFSNGKSTSEGSGCAIYGDYGTYYFYNNVIYNFENGFILGHVDSDNYVKNNIVYGSYNGSDFDLFNVTSNAGFDYNISSDATAPGGNSQTNVTIGDIAFLDTTSGSEDFHIHSWSSAYRAGVGSGTDANVPSVDIDGFSRPAAATSIGADELYDVITSGTIYVNVSTGDDTEPTANIGNSGTPLASVNEARERISSSSITGDVTVKIASGTYDVGTGVYWLDIPSSSSGRLIVEPVTFASAISGMPVIDRTASDSYSSNFYVGGYTTVRGLHFDGDGDVNSAGVKIANGGGGTGDSVIVERNYFNGADSDIDYAVIFVYGEYRNDIIRNNIFDGINDVCVRVTEHQCCNTDNDSGFVIVNNTAYNSGRFLYIDDEGANSKTFLSDVVIANNLISSANDTIFKEDASYGDGGSYTVYNTVYETSAGTDIFNSGDFTKVHCDSSAVNFVSTSNASGDYMKIASTDYPCIDGGDTRFAPSTDFYGNARDGAPDVGAIESAHHLTPDTIWVSVNGNDANDGSDSSSANAKLTLQGAYDAIGAAPSGPRVIMMLAGTYSEGSSTVNLDDGCDFGYNRSLTIGSAYNEYNDRAHFMHSTDMSGGESLISVNTEYVNLEGLRFSGKGSALAYGIQLQESNLYIHRCIFEGGEANEFLNAIIIPGSENVDNLEISGNIFMNIYQADVKIDYDAGDTEPIDGFRLLNNTSYNGATLLRRDHTSAAGGEVCLQDDALIANNIVINSSGAAFSHSLDATPALSDTVRIRNTILYNCGSNYHNSYIAIDVDSTSNPLIESFEPGHARFMRPAEESPAIDNGLDTNVYTAKDSLDFYNVDRGGWGTGFDIGAVEDTGLVTIPSTDILVVDTTTESGKIIVYNSEWKIKFSSADGGLYYFEDLGNTGTDLSGTQLFNFDIGGNTSASATHNVSEIFRSDACAVISDWFLLGSDTAAVTYTVWYNGKIGINACLTRTSSGDPGIGRYYIKFDTDGTVISSGDGTDTAYTAAAFNSSGKYRDMVLVTSDYISGASLYSGSGYCGFEENTIGSITSGGTLNRDFLLYIGSKSMNGSGLIDPVSESYMNPDRNKRYFEGSLPLSKGWETGSRGYYPFNENDSAYDYSGLSNTGTYSGSGYTGTGKYGNALLSTAGVSFSDNQDHKDLLSYWTAACWIKRSGTGLIIDKNDGSTGYSLSINGSNQLVFTYNGTSITGSSTIASGEWTHIGAVGSKSDDQIILYVNGQRDAVSSHGSITECTDGLALNGGSVGDMDELYLLSMAPFPRGMLIKTSGSPMWLSASDSRFRTLMNGGFDAGGACYESRASEKGGNSVSFEINSAYPQYEPNFCVTNVFLSGSYSINDMIVKLNGLQLTKSKDYTIGYDSEYKIVYVSLSGRVLSGRNRIYIGLDRPPEDEAMPRLHITEANSDSLVIRNFDPGRAAFGPSGSNEFELVWNFNVASASDRCGEISSWKSSEISPRSYLYAAENLIDEPSSNTGLDGSLHFQYYRGRSSVWWDSWSNNDVQYTILDSSDVRVTFVSYGKQWGSDKPNHIFTIYPTGRVFVKDSILLNANDYGTKYLGFSQREGSGATAVTNDDSLYGGFYGSSEIHDFAVGYLTSMNNNEVNKDPWDSDGVKSSSSGKSLIYFEENSGPGMYSSDYDPLYLTSFIDFHQQNMDADTIAALAADIRNPYDFSGTFSDTWLTYSVTNDGLNTSTDGDFDTDGFNESYGTYEINMDANDGVALFDFGSSTVPRYYPAFRFHNYRVQTPPTIYLLKGSNPGADTVQLTPGYDYNFDINDGKLMVQFNIVFKGDDWKICCSIQPDLYVSMQEGAFRATPLDGGASLLWVTQTEVDNKGFNIYRLDGHGGLERENGLLVYSRRGGNSAMPTEYDYTVDGLDNGTRYGFVLSSVDIHGHEDILDTAFVIPAAVRDDDYDKMYAFPVPAGINEEFMYFSFRSDKNFTGTLRIFDALGNLVIEKTSNYSAGTGSKRLRERWNLRSSSGRRVGAGGYVAVMEIRPFGGGKRRVLRTPIVVK